MSAAGAPKSLPVSPPGLEALTAALEAGDLAAARRALDELRGTLGLRLDIAAEVLHELRQPLVGIKAYCQLVQEQGGASPQSAALVLAQVERIEQIVADFYRLTHHKPVTKERVFLSAVARDAEQHFTGHGQGRGRLELDVTQDSEVLGNPRLLSQLLLNLLANAREASAEPARLKIVVGREQGQPTVWVADWGPGIPAELRGRVFEPYVSSKGRGSGLGLSVCRKIALEHDAELSLVSPAALPDQPPPSTVFRLRFTGTAATAAQSRKRLLVVDDEAIIRMVFRDLLSRDYDVSEASSAEQALELLVAQRFDLLVIDKNLPGKSGLELAQAARMADPESRVMLMTGYPSVVSAQQALELGVMDYLTKPFDDIREVRQKVAAAVAATLPREFRATNKRVDVYEDDPGSARALESALTKLGMDPRVLPQEASPADEPPAAIVVSWEFAPAHGPKALELARRVGRGCPFVVFADHLTLEATIDCLRSGAAACLPKLFADNDALGRELARALKLA